MNRFLRHSEAVAIGLCSLVLLATTVGCRPSTSKISATVKASMQETLDTDPDLKRLHLSVESVTVIRANGNVYQGLATVTSANQSHDVPVGITADGENIMWQTDSGAFSQFALESLQQSPATDADNLPDTETLADQAVQITRSLFRFQGSVTNPLQGGSWTGYQLPLQANQKAGDWVFVIVHYSVRTQDIDCQWRIGFRVGDPPKTSADALDGCAKTMFEPVGETAPSAGQPTQ